MISSWSVFRLEIILSYSIFSTEYKHTFNSSLNSFNIFNLHFNNILKSLLFNTRRSLQHSLTSSSVYLEFKYIWESSSNASYRDHPDLTIPYFMSICKDTKRVISTNVLIYTNGTLQTYTKRLIITLPQNQFFSHFYTPLNRFWSPACLSKINNGFCSAWICLNT